jgi:hypothetical protein
MADTAVLLNLNKMAVFFNLNMADTAGSFKYAYAVFFNLYKMAVFLNL